MTPAAREQAERARARLEWLLSLSRWQRIKRRLGLLRP